MTKTTLKFPLLDSIRLQAESEYRIELPPAFTGYEFTISTSNDFGYVFGTLKDKFDRTINYLKTSIDVNNDRSAISRSSATSASTSVTMCSRNFGLVVDDELSLKESMEFDVQLTNLTKHVAMYLQSQESHWQQEHIRINTQRVVDEAAHTKAFKAKTEERVRAFKLINRRTSDVEVETIVADMKSGASLEGGGSVWYMDLITRDGNPRMTILTCTNKKDELKWEIDRDHQSKRSKVLNEVGVVELLLKSWQKK